MNIQRITIKYCICLLYTSDAADDLLCVDLGGRRIIKKKIHAHEKYFACTIFGFIQYFVNKLFMQYFIVMRCIFTHHAMTEFYCIWMSLSCRDLFQGFEERRHAHVWDSNFHAVLYCHALYIHASCNDRILLYMKWVNHAEIYSRDWGTSACSCMRLKFLSLFAN